MIFSVTPRSSSISSDDGCNDAARWSSTGAGSCSNTVTGTPRRLSASAQTMPTGPAPTMATRAFGFGPGIPSRGLLRLQVEIAHQRRPTIEVVGDDLIEFGR